MNLQELKKQHAAKAREARAVYRKITDTTPEKEARKIEREFDTLMAEIDSLQAQIEDARDAKADQGGDPRRPRGEDGEARMDGQAVAPVERSVALRPDQRMVDWVREKRGAGDEMEQLSLGKLLRAMLNGAPDDITHRALSAGTDSAGGYTIQENLSARLIDNLRSQAVVTRAGANVVPLTSDTNSWAVVASDPTPAWRSENATVSESDPTFSNVLMKPKSLAVMVRLSRELFEDSLNLEEALPQILAAAMAVELDRAALLGSGTDPEPEGIANVTGIGTTAHDAALASFSPLITARTGILSANAGPVSALIMHPRDAGTLDGLTASDGQPLQAPRSLQDLPMLTTTGIPTDGGAGSDESTIFAGNFSKLLIGIRSRIRVEILRERYADNMQFGMLAHLRADFAVEHAAAFHTITGVQG